MTNPIGKLSAADRELCDRWQADKDCTPAMCEVVKTGIIRDDDMAAQLIEDLNAAIEACNDLLTEGADTATEEDASNDLEGLQSLLDFLTGKPED